MTSSLYGWVDGERVPLAPVDEVVWPDELDDEAAGPARTPGGWWPGEAARILCLEILTRGEACQISEAARNRVAHWLAMDGLHPMSWARRWSMLLWRLAPDRLPTEARALFGAAAQFEAAVMRAFFPTAAGSAREARAERARLDSVFRGLGPKLAPWRAGGGGESIDVLTDAAEALAWCDYDGEPVAGAAEEAREVARLAMHRLALWIATDGGWSLTALKRYYSLVFVRYAELAPGMNGNDYGMIYGQTRAAFSEDAKRYLGEPAEYRLGYRPKASGQKSAEASTAYAENAARHCPRRQLGGKHAFSADRSEDERKRQAEVRLDEARALAEQRQIEREAEEMRRIAERNRGRRVGRRGEVNFMKNNQTQATQPAPQNDEY